MAIVLENEYLKMQLDAANNFIETIWTTSPLMDGEAYQQVMLSYAQQLQLHRPEILLVDGRKAEYAITPDVQDWLNENIYPKIAEAGVRKLAFLIGSDLFVNISLEQVAADTMANEAVSNQLQQQFFDDRNKALEWLRES